jgi:hypothetical protein
MRDLTLGEIQMALGPSSTLSPSEKAEVLRLLAQLEQAAEAETFEDPRCPMADYLVEFGGAPHPVVRPVSWPAGERPPIAEFIASFTPAMPPTPPKSEAKVSTVPDIALVVPPRRRPKLLDAVLERTQEEMMRSTQSDDDRLHPYRGVGQLHLDGGGFTDE